MTAEHLEQWRALADAATPGPWGSSGRYIYAPDRYMVFAAEHDTLAETDAAFIAAAREAVPALLAEVERLRGELAAEQARLKLEPTAAENEEYRERAERIDALLAEHGRDGTQWPIAVRRELRELKTAQDVYEARYCQEEVQP